MELLIQQIKQGKGKPVRQSRPGNPPPVPNPTMSSYNRSLPKPGRFPNNPQPSHTLPNFNMAQYSNHGQNQNYSNKNQNYQRNPYEPNNNNANYDPNLFREQPRRGRGRNPSFNNRQFDPNLIQEPPTQMQDFQQRRFPLPPSPPPNNMNYSKPNSSYRVDNYNPNMPAYQQPDRRYNQYDNKMSRAANYKQSEFNSNTQERYSPERGDYRGKSRGRGEARGRGQRGRGRTNGFRQPSEEKEEDSRKFQEKTNKFAARGNNRQRGGNNRSPNQYPKYEKASQPKKNVKKNVRKQSAEEEEESAEMIPSESEYQSVSDENEESYQQGSYLESEVEGENEEQEERELSADQEQSIRQEDKQQQSYEEGSQEEEGGQGSKMCSRKQFEKRMQTFNQNNPYRKQGTPLKLDTSKSFSLFEINKRTNMPDLQLTIKKFQRSANRQGDTQVEKDDQNYVPRNRTGLIRTMEHIKREVLDSEYKSAKQLAFPIPPGQRQIEFIQIYMFLWDRMREIIKDITRLSEQNKSHGGIVQICEEITRFFILSINQGRKKYEKKLEFDEKNNKESLTKIMTPLLQIYTESKLKLYKLIRKMQQQKQQLSVQNIKKKMDEKGIYISPNQPQITSYIIIFSEEFRKYLYQNLFVGFEFQDTNPLFDSKEIQQALEIKSALGMKNYAKYFEMIESMDVDYLTSCLMTVNIEGIRNQISRQCEKSFKYLEMGSISKGVEENDFREMLHFTQKQQQEYHEFLRNIKAYITPGGYVSWDSNMKEQQKLYMSPEYPALELKLNRKLFQTSYGKKSNIMLKTEIVSRSWHRSNYVQDLITCLLGHQPKQKISKSILLQPEPNEFVAEKGEPYITLSTEPSAQVVADDKKKKKDELDKIMKEMNRKKFLQKLSIKFADLFRPDESKEERKLNGCKKILNWCQKRMRNQFIEAFNGIQRASIFQIQKIIHLVKLNEFLETRKRFVSEFRANQYNNYEMITGSTKKKMSYLLQRPTIPYPADAYLEQNHVTNLPEILVNSHINEFVVKFFSDVGPEEPNYKIIDKIVGNLFNFLIGPIKMFNVNHENKNYVYIDNNMKIYLSLHILNDTDEDWIHFLGADSIILLQSKPSITSFEKAFHKIKKIKNCIKQLNNYSTPCAIINLMDTSRRIFFNQSNILKPTLYIPQFLNEAAFKLSPALSLNLIGLMNLSASKYRKRQQIQAKSLNQLIKEIHSNIEYVNNFTSKLEDAHKLTLIYYQQYMNMCFQHIFKRSKSYYLSPELFSNWAEVVEDIVGEELKISIEESMKIQYNQLENLSISLKLSTPYEAVENKLVLDKHDFAIHYFNYLKKFDFNQKLLYKQMLTDIEALNIKNGQIEGSVTDFFAFIFRYLEGFLEQFYIAMPVEFRFNLSSTQLKQRVDSILQKLSNKAKKHNEKLQSNQILNIKITIPNMSMTPINENQNQNQNLSQKRDRPNHFKYEREVWLNEVKKKLKVSN